MSEKIDTVCGMWERVSKKGISYFSGSVKEDVMIRPQHKLMIFQNRKKASEKDPDYWLCLTEKNQEMQP